MPEERIVLEDQADMAVLHGQIGRVLAVEERCGRRSGELRPGDQPQQRRLAGARRSKQRDEVRQAAMSRSTGRDGSRRRLRKGANRNRARRAARCEWKFRAYVPSVGGERVRSARRHGAIRGTVLSPSVTSARACKEGPRARKRRRCCIHCRVSPPEAELCWSGRECGRKRPTPRRIRPWRARCTAGRRRAGPI